MLENKTDIAESPCIGLFSLLSHSCLFREKQFRMLLRQRRARLRGLHASVLPRVLFEQRASLGTSPQPSNDFDTQKRPPNFWNDVGNQKQWFNQVGLKLGFKEVTSATNAYHRLTSLHATVF